MIGLLLSFLLVSDATFSKMPADEMCYVYGKIKIVPSNGTFKVRKTHVMEDLRVVITDDPDSCGKWQFVPEDFDEEDFDIQFVDEDEDFSVKFVDKDPGKTQRI